MKTKLALIAITIVIAATISTSCTPTGYIVDTTPYNDAIIDNPEAVIMKPEDVQEVGGFQFEGGAIIETNEGRINLSESGVRGEVVIDLRDAPQSAITGGK